MGGAEGGLEPAGEGDGFSGKWQDSDGAGRQVTFERELGQMPTGHV